MTVLLNNKMYMLNFLMLHDGIMTEYITTGVHFTYLEYNVNLVVAYY